MQGGGGLIRLNPNRYPLNLRSGAEKANANRQVLEVRKDPAPTFSPEFTSRSTGPCPSQTRIKRDSCQIFLRFFPRFPGFWGNFGLLGHGVAPAGNLTESALLAPGGILKELGPVAVDVGTCHESLS